MFYMHGAGWGWWLLMSLGMVAFWGLVLYGILSLMRGKDRGERDGTTAEAPLTILKRRLAAGEISIEEYEQLSGALVDRPRVHAPA